MRIDAIIDREQVVCPNASHLGFDEYRAQFGDLIVFKENNLLRVGRVAGRIKYAPAIGSEQEGTYSPSIRNWILVIVFGEALTHVFERWVNPLDVTRVHGRTDVALDLMAFVLSPDFKKHSPDVLRVWSETGFSNPQDWYNYRANQK